ncbi:MAG: hypothetical protein ABIJ16_08125, partial [Bacteroidota bacterium]
PDTIFFEESYQASVQPAPDANWEDQGSKNLAMLKEELDKLEDWQRILLLMRAQNYSYHEISGYVGKPEDQLKVYHMRCLKKITEQLNSRITTEK